MTEGHQPSPDSDEATWRDELAALLGPTTFPCTSQDATVNLLRAHAPSRLLRRLSTIPPELRFVSLDALIGDIEAHSNQQPQEQVDPSPISERKFSPKERHNILLQEMIDDLARTSRGLPASHVVRELAQRIADQHMPAEPETWLNAVADAAVIGNAYVMTATTLRACDVPPPSTHRSGKTLT
ncbi:MAG: hypothetical protein ABI083_01710 [Lapillicoccus sp.]